MILSIIDGIMTMILVVLIDEAFYRDEQPVKFGGDCSRLPNDDWHWTNQTFWSKLKSK